MKRATSVHCAGQISQRICKTSLRPYEDGNGKVANADLIDTRAFQILTFS